MDQSEGPFHGSAGEAEVSNTNFAGFTDGVGTIMIYLKVALVVELPIIELGDVGGAVILRNGTGVNCVRHVVVDLLLAALEESVPEAALYC